MSKVQRIALIADVFPPLRSSGAVQLRDLSQEMVRQGYRLTVMVPDSELDKPYEVDDINGVEVLRLKAFKTRDISYARRAINEFLMPYLMYRNLKKSPHGKVKWDGVVWYSPTIFLGPLVKALKFANDCRSYLILRDIFPDWAVDMGILGKGLPYRFFKAVERYQYALADVVGVQTPGNIAYFETWCAERPARRVELLHNWLNKAPVGTSSVDLNNSKLAGRTLFVYAGNMGVAQGMDIYIDLAAKMKGHSNIGFVFVGRGSEVARLRAKADADKLDNILFFDEIDPNEIPALYAQCHAGIVALAPRYTIHNIPGKFLSYMNGGLPVLVTVNQGNDLQQLVESEAVGRVCSDYTVATLAKQALSLAAEIDSDRSALVQRCLTLSDRLFSPSAAVKQIVSGLVKSD